MIAYISGKIIYKTDSTILILTNSGVGYEILYKNQKLNKVNDEIISLFIVHKISEYGQNLFGFDSIIQKNIFEELDNIKGVGSKIIFNILTSLEIQNWNDLVDLKLDKLTKLDGVGKATAQKFLLGLSSKLKKEIDLENDIIGKSNNIKFKEIIDSMTEWGINKNQLIRFLEDNSEEMVEMPEKEIIQYILKNINKTK